MAAPLLPTSSPTNQRRHFPDLGIFSRRNSWRSDSDASSTVSAAPNLAANRMEAQEIDAALASGHLCGDTAIAHVNGLLEEVKTAYACIEHSNLDMGGVANEVRERIGEIANELRALISALQLSESVEKNHRIARDAFAKLHAISSKTVGLFSWSCRLKAGGTTENHLLNPSATLCRFLQTFSSLSTELKRNHLVRAVNQEMKEYAEDRFQHMLRINPGLMHRRQGSEQKTTNEISGNLKVGGIDAGVFDSGVSFGFKLSNEQRMYTDDDCDPVQTNTWSLGLRLGIGGASNRKKNGFKLITQILTFGLATKASITVGTYNDYKTEDHYFKAELLRDGKKWIYPRRSGSLDSFNAKVSKGVARWKYHVSSFVRCGGKLQTAPILKPIARERKLLKGSNNEPAIHQLSKNLSSLFHTVANPNEKTQLVRLTEKAYRLQNNAIDKESHILDENAATINQHILHEMSPLPAPGGGEGGHSIVKLAYGGESNVNLKFAANISEGDGVRQWGASGSASFEKSKNTTCLERLRAAHDHLDVGYNSDIEKSKALIATLDKAGPNNPKLLFCRKTLNSLMKSDGPHYSGNLNARFETIKNAMFPVANAYKELTEMAGMMRSLQDGKLRNSLTREQKLEFEGKLDTFIKTIFGFGGTSELKENKKFFRRLKADPDFFMIETYDALSITLGRLGCEIVDAKSALLDGHQNNYPLPAGIDDLRKATDRQYSYVKEMMDNVLLPIDREKLLRGGCFQAKAISKNSTFTGTLEAMVNFVFSPLQQIPGNQNDPTGLLKKDAKDTNPSLDSLKYGMSSTLASGGVKAEIFRRIATKHPNFLRLGRYFQGRLALKGGGLTASAIDYLHSKSFANPTPGRASRYNRGCSPTNGEVSSASCAVTKAAAQVLLASGMDLTADADIQYGSRTPISREGQRKYTYESCMQWIRLSVSKSTTASLTVSAPLHALGHPITPSLTASSSNFNRSVSVEVMGNCPSHHLLVLPQLTNFMEDNSADASTIHEEEKFARIRNKFMGLGDQPHGNAEYMRNRYFVNPDAILGVLEKFKRYQTGRPILGQERTFDPSYKRTEFDRFDDDLDTRKMMESMGKARKLKAGKNETTEEFIATLQKVDPRPELSDEEQSYIDQTVTRFRLNPPTSSQELMDFFLAGPGKPPNTNPGHELFKAYCRIMEAYDDISTAVKSRVTYESQVVLDKRPLLLRMLTRKNSGPR
jgi:hypothetical protein